MMCKILKIYVCNFSWIVYKFKYNYNDECLIFIFTYNFGTFTIIFKSKYGQVYYVNYVKILITNIYSIFNNIIILTICNLPIIDWILILILNYYYNILKLIYNKIIN